MPVENESFYNLIGDEISRESIVEKMIDYYNEKLELGETRVTDFNEGSEIRNLLESIAVDLYDLMEDNYEATKIAFISTAYGEWLDLHGENPLINTPRDTGSEAVGLVTFTIPVVRAMDIIIPEETILVCEENDLEYVTDSEAVIVPGETSVEVYCTCLTVGEDGNCSANTITMIDDDNIDSTVEVTNPEAFSEGSDYEEDDDYRERLLNAIRIDNFGSIGYYQELGNNVEGVHDVLLVDDETYTRKIIVNGDAKPVTEEVLVNVLKEFTRPENIVLGHNFIVDSPDYLVLNLQLDLIVEYEFEEDLIINRLHSFFDGGITSDGYDFSGCFIGETLNETYLYSCLESLDGIIRASASISGNQSNLSSLTVNSNEVIKLGDVLINQTLIDE
ncbi:MAG: baseplate J/gp47 family protein [Methanobrevibacter sp.]|nr:baseplate J/gp47 family protein [Methanobrevibacter sp.]